MSKRGEELDPEIGCDIHYDSIKSNYYEMKYQANQSEVPPQYKPLTLLEKRFLLAVERGDLPAVRRFQIVFNIIISLFVFFFFYIFFHCLHSVFNDS